MRRLTPLVLASLLILAGCAAPAVRDAREHADRIAGWLKGYDPWIAEDVGYYLTREEKHLTVLDVSGDGHDDPGRVLIRVRGKDDTPRPPLSPGDTSSPAAVVFVCFDLEMIRPAPPNRAKARKEDWKVDITEIDCPRDIPRRTFRPPAELPARADSWLKKHLPTAVGLDAVRRVVRDLDLDPRIRQDIAAYDGTIGIALREPDGDCLFAQVWTNSAQVWVPWSSWSLPVLPAERACSAEQAADGYSY